MSKLTYFGGILLVGVLGIAFAVSLLSGNATAAITYNAPTLVDTFTNHTFFAATTTSATSTDDTRIPSNQVLRIDGAEQVTFYFSRSGPLGNSGASVFRVQTSPDGSSWNDFSRMYLVDAAKSATSTVTITAATSTVVASMDLEMNAFHFVRCIVLETTDGQHTCSASAEY